MGVPTQGDQSPQIAPLASNQVLTQNKATGEPSKESRLEMAHRFIHTYASERDVDLIADQICKGGEPVLLKYTKNLNPTYIPAILQGLREKKPGYIKALHDGLQNDTNEQLAKPPFNIPSGSFGDGTVWTVNDYIALYKCDQTAFNFLHTMVRDASPKGSGQAQVDAQAALSYLAEGKPWYEMANKIIIAGQQLKKMGYDISENDTSTPRDTQFASGIPSSCALPALPGVVGGVCSELLPVTVSNAQKVDARNLYRAA